MDDARGATGQDAWSREELEDLEKVLSTEARELRAKLAGAEEEMACLGRAAASDGGRDHGDLGSSLSEHEQGLALAEHLTRRLDQTEQAIGRIRQGDYGRCERCGQPIAEAREGSDRPGVVWGRTQVGTPTGEHVRQGRISWPRSRVRHRPRSSWCRC